MYIRRSSMEWNQFNRLFSVSGHTKGEMACFALSWFIEYSGNRNTSASFIWKDIFKHSPLLRTFAWYSNGSAINICTLDCPGKFNVLYFNHRTYVCFISILFYFNGIDLGWRKWTVAQVRNAPNILGLCIMCFYAGLRNDWISHLIYK